MAFIETVPPGRASGETAEVYRYMRKVGGAAPVAKIVQAFSLRPASMRRMIRSWELTMWCGSEPRRQKELMAAAVSRLNDCHYWIDGHEAFLQAAGGKAGRVERLVSGSVRDATPLERAVVDLARKAWSMPRRLGPADLEPLRAAAGDGALEYVLVLGGFHFINRIADLLGVEPELLPSALRRFEPLRRVGVRMMAGLLGRMDLGERGYSGTHALAAEALRAASGRVLGRTPALEALDGVAARPWALEVIALALEERERSTLSRETVAKVQAIVEASLPDSAEDATGLHPRPADPVAVFAMVGTRYAQRTTPALIAALRAQGYDDIGILDLAVAVADANQWARVHRLTGLPAGLYYDPAVERGSTTLEAVA